MAGLGSGEGGQWTFLDIITLISFMVGVMNLEENLTQGDKQDLMQEFDTKASSLLKEIHSHLEDQDNKLNQILELMGGASNG